jgi:hypothetical protein
MIRTSGFFVFTVLGVGALALACSKPQEPERSAPAPQSASSSTPAPVHPPTAPAAPSGPSDVAYDAPASWQKAENPSPMRKATFKIPKAKGDAEDAELSVSQAGGSVDMNLQRWAAQFAPKAEIKRTEKKVGDLKVTVAELHGTFSGSGMPGAPASGPREKWEMLAAIVETTPPTFFKITGPENTVNGAKADFDKMLDGMRSK